MEHYPKIKNVKALKNRRIFISFRNGVNKLYDCNPLLSDDAFQPLLDDQTFNNVKTDLGGHGISWNEEVDLSESELWINGQHTEQKY